MEFVLHLTIFMIRILVVQLACKQPIYQPFYAQQIHKTMEQRNELSFTPTTPKWHTVYMAIFRVKTENYIT